MRFPLPRRGGRRGRVAAARPPLLRKRGAAPIGPERVERLVDFGPYFDRFVRRGNRVDLLVLARSSDQNRGESLKEGLGLKGPNKAVNRAEPVATDSDYETEGHRFESCRARLLRGLDFAQRCEVLWRCRDLPDLVETAVPVLKPNGTIAQTSHRLRRHTK